MSDETEPLKSAAEIVVAKAPAAPKMGRRLAEAVAGLAGSPPPLVIPTVEVEAFAGIEPHSLRLRLIDALARVPRNRNISNPLAAAIDQMVVGVYTGNWPARSNLPPGCIANVPTEPLTEARKLVAGWKRVLDYFETHSVDATLAMWQKLNTWAQRHYGEPAPTDTPPELVEFYEHQPPPNMQPLLHKFRRIGQAQLESYVAVYGPTASKVGDVLFDYLIGEVEAHLRALLQAEATAAEAVGVAYVPSLTIVACAALLRTLADQRRAIPPPNAPEHSTNLMHLNRPLSALKFLDEIQPKE
jgi:hypothetical protein